MAADLRFSHHALLDLKGMDKSISKRIVKKLEFFANSNRPLAFAKPLSGPLTGLYRFRIGDYRAIFQHNQSGQMTILTILRVKHRREVYGG